MAAPAYAKANLRHRGIDCYARRGHAHALHPSRLQSVGDDRPIRANLPVYERMHVHELIKGAERDTAVDGVARLHVDRRRKEGARVETHPIVVDIGTDAPHRAHFIEEECVDLLCRWQIAVHYDPPPRPR